MIKVPKNPWTYIKTFIGIIIFYLVLSKIDLGRTIETLKTMQHPFFYMPLSLFLVVLVYVIGALCIYIILLPLKRVSLFRLFKYTSISWAVGLIIPAADILSLSYLLKKDGINWGPSLVISFIDKSITIIVLGVFSLLAFMKFMSIYQTLYLFFILISGLILIAAVMSSTGRRAIRKFILRKYSNKFAGFSRLLKWYLLNRKDLLALNALFTVIKLLITAEITQLIFLSLGARVPLSYILVITSAMLIIKIVPTPVNFFGLREAVHLTMAVFFYNQIGIESSITLGTYIIVFLLNYIYALAVLAFANYNTLIKETAHV